MTGRRWVPAALLTVALATPHAVTPAAAAGCPAVTRTGRWSSITLPTGAYPEYVEVVPGMSRSRPDVLIVPTQRALLRSTDGGCTWTTVLSLDGAPGVSSVRTRPTVGFVSVAVSGASRAGARTLYALAVEPATSLAVTMPVVTAVSTDGGVRWQVREADPANVADDPRCSSGASVAAGPDPKVAYLMCPVASLGEAALTTAGPMCRFVVYATSDSAVTWRATTSRFADPTTATPQTLSGCDPMTAGGSTVPVPDEAAARVLWRVAPCDTALYRSGEDGAKAARWATLPKSAHYCHYWLAAGRPRSGPVVAACEHNGVYLSSRRGSFVAPPKLPLRASEQGTYTGCVLDATRDRLLTLYFDGAKRARVFGFDLGRRTWHSVFVVPTPKAGPAWTDTGIVTGRLSPVTRMLYLRTFGSTLYRLAL